MKNHIIDTILQRKLASVRQSKTLKHYIRQVDAQVRHSLNCMAKARWGDGHVLGMIPIHNYRLRQDMRNAYIFHPEDTVCHIWWVEHDIPPYDRYRCAAYPVELTLNRQGKPKLTIHSGTTDHILSWNELEKLDLTLTQVAAEPPLVVPRSMGPASDL